LFACVAFGDGGFVAAVVAVKPDKRARFTHFQSCLNILRFCRIKKYI